MHEHARRKRLQMHANADSLVMIVITEPRTVRNRLASQKSAHGTMCCKFPHLERSVVGNLSCEKHLQ